MEKWLFRGDTTNLSQARPNILPQNVLTGCFLSERSILKPKIQARTKPCLYNIVCPFHFFKLAVMQSLVRRPAGVRQASVIICNCLFSTRTIYILFSVPLFRDFYWSLLGLLTAEQQQQQQDGQTLRSMSSSRVDVAEPPEMILHFARLKFIPRSTVYRLDSNQLSDLSFCLEVLEKIECKVREP